MTNDNTSKVKTYELRHAVLNSSKIALHINELIARAEHAGIEGLVAPTDEDILSLMQAGTAYLELARTLMFKRWVKSVNKE